jgi:hypothetical protein
VVRKKLGLKLALEKKTDGGRVRAIEPDTTAAQPRG